LRCRDELIPARDKSTNNGANGAVLWVGPFHEPQKNATISQNEH
jgi:hypothetical protein